LHVSDTAAAIITIIESGVQNNIFNISGNHEEQNIVIANKICELFGGGELDLSVTRPGQDVRYSINDDRLRSLGWRPQAKFEDELVKIVDYYRRTFVW
jgi:dTDP-D-glucose 4,6-dehydratase